MRKGPSKTATISLLFRQSMRIQKLVILSCLFVLAEASPNSPSDEQPHQQLHLAAAPQCHHVATRPNDECTIVMAPSTLGGWGVFVLQERLKGQAIMDGDVVIHLTDVKHPHAMSKAFQDYFASAEETGGFYEGQSVVAVIPGIGMLANGLPQEYSNVLPFVPQVDDGGLTRTESPGAGAITQYHNYTFFAQKDIPAGGEVFVNNRPEWFRERQGSLLHALPQRPQPQEAQPSLDWLRLHGMCLDNLRPSVSTFEHTGRGLVARRRLLQGSLVVPVPVLPVLRQDLMDGTTRTTTTATTARDGTVVPPTTTQQLLLNYCYGHSMSSLLLCPYGPMVNLVNHAGASSANVRLQWQTNVTTVARNEVEQQQHSLVLELVALRDIEPGEEILMDYGREWVEAWVRHVQTWTPLPGADRYAPSYVHDDAIQSLRTEAELKDHPYPDNIFTSCFYRFVEKPQQSSDGDVVTTVRWQMTRGLFELHNLRPCNILQRQHSKSKKGTTFTVQIRNRNGLNEVERLPKGAVHIVTHVPRHAIRFSDRIYSTDQHLENAFRHAIHFADFPEQWLDLNEE